MPKKLESDVASELRYFLSGRGWRLVRTQFAHTPGMFSTGEPGMPDYAVVRFMGKESLPAKSLFFWLEVKGPNDKRVCFCDPGKPKKLCKVCRQKKWHEKERALGAVVIVASSLESFAVWYDREFGWLHRDTTPLGNAPTVAQKELF